MSSSVARRWIVGGLVLVASGAIASAALQARKPSASPAPSPPSSVVFQVPGPDVDAGKPGDLIQEQPPCDDVVRKVTEALRSEAELSRDAQNKLFTLALRGVADAPWREKDCPLRLFEALKREMTCGLSTQVVASALFAGDRFEVAWQAELLEQATPNCQEPMLVASQTSSKTSLQIVNALLKLAKSAKAEDGPMLAWLSLGAHEGVARKASQKDVVNIVDKSIASELARAKDQHRIDLLEAAGNGPCIGCRPQVLVASTDPSPYVRRAALGALRLFEDEPAVVRMCVGLAKDRTPLVREHLAWALRWTETHIEKRVDCLEKAARQDDESSVRMSSTGSLTYLSEDLQDAYDAILELREDGPEDVQRAVEDHLRVSDGPAKPVAPILGLEKARERLR